MKAAQIMPSIPPEDLQKVFDELDVAGDDKIKVKNLVKELKAQIHKEGSEKLSLLTVDDIKPRYGSMSPRSCSSFVIDEIKNHCETENYRLEEIFRVSKEGTKKYTTKKRLREEFRHSLPSLSRTIIEEILKDFTSDDINYTEYLIYFDLKDSRIKSEEFLSKAQRIWIKKYTDVLAKNNVTPEEVLKDADKNNDGIISLKELKKAVKQYTNADDLSFKDLQHILDALDINNDGKVTTKEYQTVVKKYSAKGQGGDIVKNVVKACRDNGHSLKEAFSKCSFDDNSNISVVTAQRKIKSISGLGSSEVNQLIELLKDGKSGVITGDRIFEF